MKPRRITRMLGVIIAGMIGLLAQGDPRAVAADAGGPNAQSGVEVLTRGPVHEAFAEPNSYNPTPGVVVPKQAPAAIEEIPPDEKPDGDALWIPGYWQWDSERSDFIWISGIWRVPPPGCSWVPGYWTAVADGWAWTSGFWMANQTEEVTYLPQPPKSLEVGPSSPAPSADTIWAPGCWIWADDHYAWRPGYWVQARPDWVWSPAYYVDTPRGSVYVDGFWDWNLDRRGVLFAPAYIPSSLWGQPGYAYSPSIVIQTDLLTAHLFISPGYRHYYFGDYYGADYSRRGFYPWFEYQKNHRGYDPIYAHERWNRGRTDSRWESQVRSNYDYRMTHAEARPPRTYAAQAAFAARAPERERKNIRIAAPLSEVAQRRDAPIHFEKINDVQRKSLGGQGKDLAQYRDQRAQWESPGGPASKVKAVHAAPGTPQVPKGSPGEQARKPGETQPVRSAREPVRVQPNRAPTEPVQAQPNRAPMRSGGGQATQPSVREKTYQAPQSTEPQRQRIPRSPVVSRSAREPSQGVRPPSRPEMPKPDSNFRSHQPANRDKARSEAPASRPNSPSEGRSQDNRGNTGEKNRGK